MTAIKYKRIWNGNSNGGAVTSATLPVVTNFSALPAPASASGKFYWVSNTEGSKWMQAIYLGTFYNKGLYYSDGITWEYSEVPFQATQADVNAGIITDQFVSPSALLRWSSIGQANTGCLTFASPGLSIATTTKINIGAVHGWVIDNETTPGIPIPMEVNYAGETNKTVTTIGSGLISYILLSSIGVITFQNTEPTSAQRKAYIWLGKVSHPNSTTLAFINNEPDFITSNLSQFRDLFQVLGPYINDGVIASANGANLNINISAGNIHGDGINFVTNKTIPNEVATGPYSPLSFLHRTQTGVGGGFTTTLDVANYDLAGVITAISGGTGTSTIKYIYAVPNVGFVIQYGQNLYNNLTEAIANVGREAQIIYPNLISNAILIGVIVTTKSCTALNNATTARFFQADKIGQIVGSTAGISTGTLQTAYNNSVDPEILTDATRDGVTIRRGSAADTDNILVGQNGTGTNRFLIKGNGIINLASYTVGTLPTGVTGDRAYVTNALAPTYGAIVLGGGTITIPVFYDGVNWITV